MGNEKSLDSQVIANDEIRQHKTPSGDVNRTSPFIHEFFLVQGNNFRCMAYRNDDGKWHGAFNDEVLPGAIRVLA